MSAHPSLHFALTLGLFVATMAMLAVVRTRALKRRLTFASVAFVLASALHYLVTHGQSQPALADVARQGPAVEYLLIAFGVLASLVALAFNPWWTPRPERGVPSIVQDALLVLLTFIAALFFFQNSNLIVGVTGSAIVIGLALQETLGNAFSGLALQIERPFRVGHWVTVADHEGRVVEVTWRATKIETKSGNMIALPNSEIAKTAITNYSQPAAPTRLQVEVGASYATPPNETKDAMMAAMRRVPQVLAEPAPDVLLVDFAASSINYRARFWINDFRDVERATSDVRTAIYYEFSRRNIEIPYPIQVEYSRTEAVVDREAEVEEATRMIAAVPVFADMSQAGRRALALASRTRLYADGEAIVREGEQGGTMYLVRRGRVVVVVGKDRRQVAVTEEGGYFGEMSLLTGEPRTATVIASGDCVLFEIAADDFRHYVQDHPDVIDDVAAAAETRRRQLDAARSDAATDSTEARQSVVEVMRRFFGLE